MDINKIKNELKDINLFFKDNPNNLSESIFNKLIPIIEYLNNLDTLTSKKLINEYPLIIENLNSIIDKVNTLSMNNEDKFDILNKEMTNYYNDNLTSIDTSLPLMKVKKTNSDDKISVLTYRFSKDKITQILNENLSLLKDLSNKDDLTIINQYKKVLKLDKKLLDRLIRQYNFFDHFIKSIDSFDNKEFMISYNKYYSTDIEKLALECAKDKFDNPIISTLKTNLTLTPEKLFPFFSEYKVITNTPLEDKLYTFDEILKILENGFIYKINKINYPYNIESDAIDEVKYDLIKDKTFLLTYDDNKIVSMKKFLASEIFKDPLIIENLKKSLNKNKIASDYNIFLTSFKDSFKLVTNQILQLQQEFNKLIIDKKFNYDEFIILTYEFKSNYTKNDKKRAIK